MGSYVTDNIIIMCFFGANIAGVLFHIDTNGGT